MEYRKATDKDAKGIAKVLLTSYNLSDEKEAKLVFQIEKEKLHYYIVADDQGKIAGLVTWKMHGLPKHGLCELDRIAVLPGYKGKGVAKKLFDQLVKDASLKYKKHGFKLRKLFILTHADNGRAHAFYTKMGCKHETTLKNHYYEDKAEFVFSKFFH